MNMIIKDSELARKFLLDKINPTWNDFFFTGFGLQKVEVLLEKLSEEWDAGPCYPARENIFRLFRELPLDKLKVVIIGQDPYHQPGVADGLAFSTGKRGLIPASLRNILTELKNDLRYDKQIDSGELTN